MIDNENEVLIGGGPLTAGATITVGDENVTDANMTNVPAGSSSSVTGSNMTINKFSGTPTLGCKLNSSLAEKDLTGKAFTKSIEINVPLQDTQYIKRVEYAPPATTGVSYLGFEPTDALWNKMPLAVNGFILTNPLSVPAVNGTISLANTYFNRALTVGEKFFCYIRHTDSGGTGMMRQFYYLAQMECTAITTSSYTCKYLELIPFEPDLSDYSKVGYIAGSPGITNIAVGTNLSGKTLVFDTSKTVSVNNSIINAFNMDGYGGGYQLVIFEDAAGTYIELRLTGSTIVRMYDKGWLVSSYTLPDDMGNVISVTGTPSQLNNYLIEGKIDCQSNYEAIKELEEKIEDGGNTSSSSLYLHNVLVSVTGNQTANMQIFNDSATSFTASSLLQYLLSKNFISSSRVYQLNGTIQIGSFYYDSYYIAIGIYATAEDVNYANIVCQKVGSSGNSGKETLKYGTSDGMFQIADYVVQIQ